MKKTLHCTISGDVTLLSGTRVGGSDDVLQIGGTDLTCIKDPASGKPYLPGSSLKGRMRSCLERALNKFSAGGSEPCGCAQPSCPVCLLFGPHKQTRHSLGPSRIIVHDAPLIGEFALENKSENIINRSNNTAQHPRVVERVAPGAKFALKIGVQVFDSDSSFKAEDENGVTVTGRDALLEIVYMCLGLMAESGVGSGNSKGYGAIDVAVHDCTETVPGKVRIKPKAA